MTKKRNVTWNTENVLAIVLPLTVIICFFSFTAVVTVTVWKLSNDELLVYSQTEVHSICKDLNAFSDDVFCSNTSEQNMETFVAMLERNYPLDETTYLDIFPLISLWSASNWSCDQATANAESCLSSQCYESVDSNDLYLCVFDTPVDSDELRVWVNKITGIIERYEIISTYEYL
jgi:hypothetical protein